MHQGFAYHFFQRFLDRPRHWLVVVLVSSLGLGWFAAKVQADYAVEYLFPERSAATITSARASS